VKKYTYFLSHLAHFFLERETFPTGLVEKTNTHFHVQERFS